MERTTKQTIQICEALKATDAERAKTGQKREIRGIKNIPERKPYEIKGLPDEWKK